MKWSQWNKGTNFTLNLSLNVICHQHCEPFKIKFHSPPLYEGGFWILNTFLKTLKKNDQNYQNCDISLVISETLRFVLTGSNSHFKVSLFSLQCPISIPEINCTHTVPLIIGKCLKPLTLIMVCSFCSQYTKKKKSHNFCLLQFMSIKLRLFPKSIPHNDSKLIIYTIIYP